MYRTCLYHRKLMNNLKYITSLQCPMLILLISIFVVKLKVSSRKSKWSYQSNEEIEGLTNWFKKTLSRPIAWSFEQD